MEIYYFYISKFRKLPARAQNLYLTYCMKSVRIRSLSGPYFPAFGLKKLRIRTFSRSASNIVKTVLLSAYQMTYILWRHININNYF